LNQRNVVHNCYPGLAQECLRRGFEEVPIPCAENIGFANQRGLHNDGVVYIANRRNQ
jgi:hypothetical protein